MPENQENLKRNRKTKRPPNVEVPWRQLLKGSSVALAMAVVGFLARDNPPVVSGDNIYQPASQGNLNVLRDDDGRLVAVGTRLPNRPERPATNRPNNIPGDQKYQTIELNPCDPLKEKGAAVFTEYYGDPSDLHTRARVQTTYDGGTSWTSPKTIPELDPVNDQWTDELKYTDTGTGCRLDLTVTQNAPITVTSSYTSFPAIWGINSIDDGQSWYNLQPLVSPVSGPGYTIWPLHPSYDSSLNISALAYAEGFAPPDPNAPLDYRAAYITATQSTTGPVHYLSNWQVTEDYPEIELKQSQWQIVYKTIPTYSDNTYHHHFGTPQGFNNQDAEFPVIAARLYGLVNEKAKIDTCQGNPCLSWSDGKTVWRTIYMNNTWGAPKPFYSYYDLNIQKPEFCQTFMLVNTLEDSSGTIRSAVSHFNIPGSIINLTPGFASSDIFEFVELSEPSCTEYGTKKLYAISTRLNQFASYSLVIGGIPEGWKSYLPTIQNQVMTTK